MNYIKLMKWRLDRFIEFYESYKELDAAHKRFETISYKGDAQQAIQKAYNRLNAAIPDIDQIVASIKQEEVKKNAG